MYLLSASKNGNLKLLDPFDIQVEIYNITVHRGLVRYVTINDLGDSFITLGSDKVMKLWDLRTGTVAVYFPQLPHAMYIAVFNRAGTRIASVSDTGRLLIWNTSTGHQLRRWLIGKKNVSSRNPYTIVTALSFSSDGSSVVILGQDCEVKIWETESGLLISCCKHFRDIWNCDFCPNDVSKIAAFDAAGDVTVTLPGNPSSPSIYSIDGLFIYIIKISNDGTKFVTGSRDGLSVVWNFASGSEICRFAGHCHQGQITQFQFNFDDSLISSLSSNGRMFTWSSETGIEMQSLFDPDLVFIAVGGNQKTESFWK